MTKHRYRFGDDYIVSQMRQGFVTYEIYPGHSVIIHVRGARPLIALAGDQ